ncbi:cobalamin B12-binding domain-containing protein [Hymenobacter actinosclerus]|uniref:Methylaspartate mutase sigma subunit n=1 Tax=Hymenobacter actinosclerus TaxID=82805 RepID=A0A1I0II68_9BACT|nr:cobalamin-dependent protein [Hymenobacter actinosclerus]SET96791.1 methylaspartate mutase sigma subunit [Hymenobacter actinosclerus]
MKALALLTTVPSDAHNWNLIFMQLLLEENGFTVINLGPCVPYDLLASACLKHNPDVVVVSTINGHGFIEGKALITETRKVPGLADTPFFIGGKLSTDATLSHLYAVELELAGYRKAFNGGDGLPDFLQQLEQIKSRKTTLSVLPPPR